MKIFCENKPNFKNVTFELNMFSEIDPFWGYIFSRKTSTFLHCYAFMISITFYILASKLCKVLVLPCITRKISSWLYLGMILLKNLAKFRTKFSWCYYFLLDSQVWKFAKFFRPAIFSKDLTNWLNLLKLFRMINQIKYFALKRRYRRHDLACTLLLKSK